SVCGRTNRAGSAQRVLQEPQDFARSFAARHELPPGAQGKCEAPAFLTLHIGNAAQVDDRRAIDAYEIGRREQRRELLQRCAREEALGSYVNRHIVTADLEIVDRIDLEKMKSMRALADEQSIRDGAFFGKCSGLDLTR